MDPECSWMTKAEEGWKRLNRRWLRRQAGRDGKGWTPRDERRRTDRNARPRNCPATAGQVAGFPGGWGKQNSGSRRSCSSRSKWNGPKPLDLLESGLRSRLVPKRKTTAIHLRFDFSVACTIKIVQNPNSNLDGYVQIFFGRYRSRFSEPCGESAAQAPNGRLMRGK